LYTAVGSYGIPCVVDTDEPFCFQRHIAIIKPDHSAVDPRYLAWALTSRDVFDQATSAATGSAQLTVPLRAIRELRFPLPSMQRQREIASFLDSIKSKVETCAHLQQVATRDLGALLPSVLAAVFDVTSLPEPRLTYAAEFS
jgi:type I restriction enzyme S subunit